MKVNDPYIEYRRTDLAFESAEMSAVAATDVKEYRIDGFLFASMSVGEDDSARIGRTLLYMDYGSREMRRIKTKQLFGDMTARPITASV